MRINKFLKTEDSFTLVELLVVIGILAILTAAVVIVLNPAELLKQSRDSSRMTDLANISKGIQLLLSQNPSTNLGNASTVYVSLPDTSSSCANLGLPTLPLGYSYACVASASSTLANGQGWLPVDFSASPVQNLSKLPIDPSNASSSWLYYLYIPSGSGTFEIAGSMESEKYFSKSLTDAGGDSMRYERGSNLSLANLYLGGSEILANGGMESSSGGLASSWSNIVGGSGSVAAADAEAANIISGSRTQKMTVNAGWGGQGLRQGLSGLICGGVYRARTFYKLNIANAAFYGVYDIAGGGQGTLFVGTMLSDGKVHSVESVFQVPSNCSGTAYMDVPRFDSSSLGSVYIDEVSLRRIK